SKLAEAMYSKDLAEKLKDSNISVTVAAPGPAHTNLRSNAVPFFLYRWIFNSFSFILGSTKEAAAQPVLYAVADSEMEGENGMVINNKLKEQDWVANVE
ncbi:hypothetical protein PMAYCL1PPCAC_27394, partial [Pristionchus mayeri]